MTSSEVDLFMKNFFLRFDIDEDNLELFANYLHNGHRDEYSFYDDDPIGAFHDKEVQEGDVFELSAEDMKIVTDEVSRCIQTYRHDKNELMVELDYIMHRKFPTSHIRKDGVKSELLVLRRIVKRLRKDPSYSSLSVSEPV